MAADCGLTQSGFVCFIFKTVNLKTVSIKDVNRALLNLTLVACIMQTCLDLSIQKKLVD